MMTGKTAQDAARHIPVLRGEAVGLLAPRAGGTYVDGTFGAGGHARAILAVPGTRVIGIDRDPSAIAEGEALAEQSQGRLVLIRGRFSRMEELLAARGAGPVDGVLLDLGVSSMQLEEAERGFSFLREGPLDMRMEQTGESAADVVNAAPERELADILWRYGEERRARAIARAIAQRRREKPFSTTLELAGLVERVLGPKKAGQAHPATRTFQALRIRVNRELEEIVRGLAAAERILKPGGVLAVISFHSLEDRIVKRFFAARTGRAGRPSRHLPEPASPPPSFIDLTKGGLTPSEEETAANPRARSARLRAGRRTEAAPVAPEAEPSGMWGKQGGRR